MLLYIGIRVPKSKLSPSFMPTILAWQQGKLTLRVSTNKNTLPSARQAAASEGCYGKLRWVSVAAVSIWYLQAHFPTTEKKIFCWPSLVICSSSILCLWFLPSLTICLPRISILFPYHNKNHKNIIPTSKNIYNLGLLRYVL